MEALKTNKPLKEVPPAQLASWDTLGAP
jgi:hypothetical protein